MKDIFKTVFTFGILGIMLLTSECSKNRKFLMLPPVDPFYLRININGNFIADSNYLSKLVLYYYDHGRRVQNADNIDPSNSIQYDHPSLLYLLDPSQNESWRQKGVLASGYLCIISSQHRVDNDDFYLKLPNGDIDTIYLEAESVSNEQGKKEDCYCLNPIRVVKFDGKDAPLDTTLSTIMQRVYILYK